MRRIIQCIKISGTLKIVLRGKFITLSAYIKIKISNKQPNVILKNLEKQEQTIFKTCRRQEIRSEMKLMTQKKSISVTKSWCFENMSKIDEPLTKLNKRKRSPR